MRLEVAESAKLIGFLWKLWIIAEKVAMSFHDRVGNGIGLTFKCVRIILIYCCLLLTSLRSKLREVRISVTVLTSLLSFEVLNLISWRQADR